ncbi:MAG: WD40 repeat domain-containing protein [Candidatus Coatesbacteria bacterium]|nr:WD40 repeat domain-containing protein [Candidatus Coatesbacteria bacterium]
MLKAGSKLCTILVFAMLILLSCGDESSDEGNGTGTGTGTGDELSIKVTDPPSYGSYSDDYYTIRWTYKSREGTFPLVTLYYDTDTISGGEIKIAENIAAYDSAYVWNTINLPSFTSYYILAVINDDKTSSKEKSGINRTKKRNHSSYRSNYSLMQTNLNPDCIGERMAANYDYSDGTVTINHCCLIKTLTGHNGAVYSVCISSDGRNALSGSDDTTLKYWDLSNGACLKTFYGHSSIVYSACMSRDCQYALSGGWDKTVKYWRISDGTCLRSFTGHNDAVYSVSISPDGQYALSGSADNTIKYWKVSDGTCIRTLTGHNSYVNSICISPDGKYALSGSDDQNIKYWRLSDGICIRTIILAGIVNSVCFSPDGKYALSGGSSCKYWRLSDGKCMRTFEYYYTVINSVSISPEGKHALSAEEDNNFFRISDGVMLNVFGACGYSFKYNSICFSPDGQYALTGCTSKEMEYWRLY